jgi:hypothetical protein
VTDWRACVEREEERYRDGLERLPEEPDARQKQLVRVANASVGAGLASLMEGRTGEAREWFTLAAERYRESYAGAPPGSFGRPIGAVKMRLLAGDWPGAEDDARWTLAQGSATAESPIGRYAATLAQLVLGADPEAASLARSLEAEPDDRFPAPVAAALVGLAEAERGVYEDGLARTLASFETREAYLEDVPVADTVLVLEVLAERRGMAARPASPLLPASL